MENGRCKVKDNLHQMFDILQMNLNSDDVERFKTQLLMSGTLGDFWKRKNQSHIPRKLYKCDAVTFLRFLESKGHIDETNTKVVQDTIKSVRPELYELTSTEICDVGEWIFKLIRSDQNFVLDVEVIRTSTLTLICELRHCLNSSSGG